MHVNREPWTVDRRAVLKGGLAAVAAGVGTAMLGPGGTLLGTGAGAAPKVPTTKPSKLVVRSWGPPWSSTIGDIPGKAFTAKTGIPVEFDLTDFTVMDTKVRLAVRSGHRPPVDVMYTIGRSCYAASAQKVLVPLDPGIVTNLAHISPAGKPQGSASDYVLVYTYTTPLIYRTDKLKLTNGMSWQVMWDAAYKGRLFVPANFDPLLFPVAKMLKHNPASGNLAPVWAKFKTLRPNIQVVGDDTPFINNMKTGEVWLGSALVGDALALQQTTKVPVDWIVPKEGAVLTGDGMYVPKNLPSDVTYWAQVFVNEVIDARLQTQWTGKVETVPTNLGATPAAFMKGNPAFPFTAAEIEKYAIPEPLAAAAKNGDGWQANYTAAIQK